MKNDTISRQKAIDALKMACIMFPPTPAQKDMVEDCLELIKNLPSARPEENCWVHIDDIYRLISGHSNYHGDTILAALTCLAEGKEVPNHITVIDAQPERMRGRWQEITASDCSGYDPVLAGYDDPVVGYVCSVCHEGYEKEVMGKTTWDFCPNCGADMRGEQDDSISD